MSARFRAQAGYTLIELVVVLMLLSFITLALSGGLKFGVRVWEGSARATASIESVSRSQAILRALFASTVPLAKTGIVEFTGNPDEVSFVAAAPRAFEHAGLVEVVLHLPDADHPMTVRMTSAGGKIRSATFAAFPGILHLSYLDASEAIPIWLDHWHDRRHLPDAIRILGASPKAQAAWPEFIARLSVTETALCHFDPISLTCSES